MAIVVLVLWAFTAMAGFYMLVTGNPGRTGGAGSPAAAAAARAAAAASAEPVPASAGFASGAPPSAGAAGAASRPEPTGRNARDVWAPPSLVAARQAPLVPGLRSVAEFAHPAAGVVGLGFWLGFTLVHARILGWIGFGVSAATVCMGLGWFAANSRAAKHPVPGVPAPSFASRLVALHGSGAALTITLAALTALLLHG
jgi:hypothetical protein